MLATDLGTRHQDPPQIHARTARGLLARQDGRRFVTAADGQDNPLDGQELKGGLGIKVLAHDD